MSLAVFEQLRHLNAGEPEYAAKFIDALLPATIAARASDVHLHPVEKSLEVRWRIDGVLQPLGLFPRGEVADVIVRLKVMAELLTYRTDIPQEGRLRAPSAVEMRISTFPTLHGERAVIRLFAATHEFRLPEELDLPGHVLETLQGAMGENQGAVIISGPAGAGKTTTAYACLRSIVRDTNTLKSVVTLEDPIESVLSGVSQSQIQANSGLTLATGLRSLLRQDPEVLLVGEIRDRETAEGVFQAALTGHLVLSTFHAGSAVEGLGRLREMGIEAYLIRSGLQAMLNQRLVRRLCSCAQPTQRSEELLGFEVKPEQVRMARGCPACLQSGYRGRLLLVEMLSRREETLSPALLQETNTRDMQRQARQSGMITLHERALAALERGHTSPQEVRRAFGFDKGK